MEIMMLTQILVFLLNIFVCIGHICLKWTVQNNKFILNCKVYPLNLRVSFYNRNNKEQAYCVLPYPEPFCFSYVATGSIVQNLVTNETLFSIERESSKTIQGRWTCLHGYNNEQASVFVMDEINSDSQISISAPISVKKKQPFSVLCSSSKAPIGRSTNILENGQLFITLQRQTYGCVVNNSLNVCLTDTCHCSEDGRTFFVKHEGSTQIGILSFSCIMNFDVIGNVSDCVFVRIIDIDGPNLALNTTSQLFVGSFVKVRCLTTATGLMENQMLICGDYRNVTVSKLNTTTYESSIILVLNHEDKICTCTATINNYTTSAFIKLDIIQAPVLDLQDKTVCTEYDSVSLVCKSQSGSLENTDFDSWLHMFAGKKVRLLNGVLVDNQSILYIKSCTFKDSGEYICRASRKGPMGTILTNKSSQVIVAGPPKIISKEKYIKHKKTVLSVKYVTLLKPNLHLWFLDERYLMNSTVYSQSHWEELVLLHIHSKMISSIAYIAQLVIDNINSQQGSYLVVVGDKFGNTTATFKSEKEHQVFPSSLIYVILIAVSVTVLVVITASLIVQRHIKGSTGTVQIYHAALEDENHVHIYHDTNSHYEDINNYEDIDDNEDILQRQTQVSSESNIQAESDKDEETTNGNIQESVHLYLELE